MEPRLRRAGAVATIGLATLPAMSAPEQPDAPQDELSGLKNRRRKTGARRRNNTAAPVEDELPELPESHESMSAALAHRPPGLPVLDPLLRRQLPVVEAGGHVPSARLDADYVVSPFDAGEQIVPIGCRTAISRTLWSAGQHVRRDVYETYLKQHPELRPTAQSEQAEAVVATGDAATGDPADGDSANGDPANSVVASSEPAGDPASSGLGESAQEGSATV